MNRLWFRISSYIKFLYRSTNQHGVHSPFVYALLIQCFYKRDLNENIKVKHSRFIAKLYHYFKPKNFCVGNIEDFDHIDMLITQDLIWKDKYSYLVHNDTLIVIKGIYSNRDALKKWKQLQNNKKITVTIDVYSYGLVFFRKEQVKQNLIVRYFTNCLL